MMIGIPPALCFCHACQQIPPRMSFGRVDLGFVHQSKAQCLPHGESREMLVIFRIIVDFAPVVLALLFSRDTAVTDFALDSYKAGSSLAITLENVEQPEPSLPSTSIISPSLTTPENHGSGRGLEDACQI